MCRIGAIKSADPVHASKALSLMLPQQEGHDNSGFAMVMQDLEGEFSSYKDKPLMSLACTQKGAKIVQDYMDKSGFRALHEWIPKVNNRPGLDIKAMPYYIFTAYDYPDYLNNSSQDQKEDLLLNTRLTLRAMLEKEDHGYVFSFWPDVLTLKRNRRPAGYCNLFWFVGRPGDLMARNVVVQCRQNTNYEIVRYAAHPFFCKDIRCAPMARIPFTQKTKNIRNRCIEDISALNPIHRISFTRCIMCCMN
jgi:hypothetical protein